LFIPLSRDFTKTDIPNPKKVLAMKLIGYDLVIIMSADHGFLIVRVVDMNINLRPKVFHTFIPNDGNEITTSYDQLAVWKPT